MGTRRQPIQTALLLVFASLAALHPAEAPVKKATTLVSPVICPESSVYSVTVTKNDADPSWTEGTTGHTAQFTVQNGDCPDTYDFRFDATGSISGVTLDRTGSGLPANGSTTVTATYNVDNPGTGQLTVYATGRLGHAAGADYYFVTATIAAGAPVVTAAVPFLEPNYRRCANSCFAAVTAQSTVPYISLDAPRQATLVYNSDRGNPRTFVLVNVSPDMTFGSFPTQYKLRVLLNGTEVRFLNGEDTLLFNYTGTAPVRLGGQFDASSYATNVYRMEALVTAVFSGSSVTNDYVTRFISVNQVSSPVARGWSFGGVQRLYLQSDGSALVVEGDGSAVYFAKTGTSTFASPSGEFSTLIPSTLSGTNGWARVFPDSTKIVFTSAGLMTRVLDRFGNRDSVVYDGSNRVSKLIDPLNLAITMAYGTNGLTSIQDPQGRVTVVTVDASKRLTAITDPDNISSSYAYDASLRLSTLTDRRGSTSTIGYDSQSGTFSTLTAPAVPVYGQGTVSPVTTYNAWQKVGVPYSATANLAFVPMPPDSIFARTTAPGGAVTRFSVNVFGQPVLTLGPLGDTLSISYTSRGQPTVVKRPGYGPTEGDTTLYSGSGLPAYVRPAGLSATNIHYGAFGQPDSTWGTARPTVRYFLGPSGRIDSVRVGWVLQHVYYNSRGQIDSTKDANFVRTVKNTRAGTNGNLSEALYAAGRFARYTYDSYGRPVTIAQSGAATDTIFYNIINRRDSVRNGVDTVAVKFGYDPGLLTSVTDSKGQTYRIAFNALGWPSSNTDPVGAADSLYYSVDGDMLRKVNRRHQYIDFAYDSLHRPTSRVGGLSMSWTYQNHGRIQSATSSVSSETTYLSAFGVDSIRTVMAGQTFWRRYRYTLAGQLDSTDVSGAGITFLGRRYLYDAKGILGTIRLNGTPTTLGVDNNLQVNSISFPGGDVESRAYTTFHDLMRTSSTGFYDGVTQRNIGFNSAGQVTEQIYADTVTGERYTYDLLGRIKTRASGHYQTNTGWCLDPDYGTDGPCHTNTVWVTTSADTFAYDAAGNRTDHGGLDTTGNRITQFDGCSYTTDADGNVTSRAGGSCLRGTATFTWHAEGLLATITTGGSTIALKYDGAGRLVRKDLNGTPQSHFLWDGSNLLAELDGNGTVKRAEYSYYPGMDRLHALIIGSTMYYAHTDAIGNVIALTDASQNVTRTYSFDVWGNLLGGNDNLPFNGYDRARWKGALQLIPELNLYYMRNRWYEGGTGRFLSEDPVAAFGANRYTYANNDPINNSDPSGLKSVYEAVAEAADKYLKQQGYDAGLEGALEAADALSELDGSAGLIFSDGGMGILSTSEAFAALIDTYIFISTNEFLDLEGGFQRSVTTTFRPVRETIFATERGLIDRGSVRERTVQGSFELMTQSDPFADEAVYYGWIALAGQPTISVRGIVSRDVEQTEFTYFPYALFPPFAR